MLTVSYQIYNKTFFKLSSSTTTTEGGLEIAQANHIFLSVLESSFHHARAQRVSRELDWTLLTNTSACTRCRHTRKEQQKAENSNDFVAAASRRTTATRETTIATFTIIQIVNIFASHFCAAAGLLPFSVAGTRSHRLTIRSLCDCHQVNIIIVMINTYFTAVTFSLSTRTFDK